MTVMTERRYPLRPLLQTTGLSPRQLRTKLAISHTRYLELARDGLTDEAADRYAIRLGHFPWNIWPTWLDDAPNWDPGHPSLRTPVPPQPPQCNKP